MGQYLCKHCSMDGFVYIEELKAFLCFEHYKEYIVEREKKSKRKISRKDK